MYQLSDEIKITVCTGYTGATTGDALGTLLLLPPLPAPPEGSFFTELFFTLTCLGDGVKGFKEEGAVRRMGWGGDPREPRRAATAVLDLGAERGAEEVPTGWGAGAGVMLFFSFFPPRFDFVLAIQIQIKGIIVENNGLTDFLELPS